jgi:hypothetical protein
MTSVRYGCDKNIRTRFFARSCAVWIMAMVPPVWGQGLPVRDCLYEGKPWADRSYRVAGKICQQCYGGTWVPRGGRGRDADPKCANPAPPGDGSHLRIDARYDCDATSATASSDRAVRLVAGKCEECNTNAWREVDSSMFCGTPRIQALKVPTLPPEMADGPYANMALGIKLIYFLKDEGFVNAQALIDSTARSKERLPDGTWVGWKLFPGYEEALQQERPWDEQLARLRQWRNEEPESGAAALLEASYWSSYAWFARGTQFSVNVPQQAFKIADERMAKARAVLEEAKPYAASNPAWFAQMLGVALFQGWPRAERIALFDEAVKAEPLYDGTYIRMANGLTPRWGGSVDDYHRFVRAAVEKTKSAYGNIMYARLYWFLSDTEWDKEPFTALKIPWQQMKSGFDDLVARYPDSQWNLQHYAYFACRAGDGKTFNALLPTLAVRLPNTMPSPWREPYTRDYCVSRFGKAGSR